MAERTRRKMSKREYNTHIFAKARGAKSPVQDLANRHYKGHWWQAPGLGAERGLAEEYEQDAIVNGRDGGEQQWFSSDASDREDFRNKQLDALRKDFRKSLRSHPEFKDRSARELTEIADAYLSGKDHDSFKSDAVKAALQEVSDYVTGDGEVAMSDERTWRGKYAKADQQGKEPGQNVPSTTSGSSDAPVTPRNGTARAPAAVGSGNPPQDSNKPVPPRSRVPASAPVEATTDRLGSDSTNQVTQINGLSDRGDATIIGSLKRAAREDAGRLATEASMARKDADQAARDRDAERRVQAGRDSRQRDDESNRHWRERNDRMKVEREDRNYKNRVANTAAEWQNLGRLRGDARDGTPLSDEDYNKKVASLVSRAKTLRSAAGRAGMSDAEVRDMNGFFKTVGKVTVDKETGAVSHDSGQKFTPAQIDALTKRIDRYEGIAKGRRAVTAARVNMHQAEQVAKLRQQYGFTDTNVFAPEDVLRFHQGEVDRRVKGALQKMHDTDPKDYTEYADNWANLGKAGADFEGAFSKALSNPETKRWFMGQIAGKSAEERDAIRRGLILDQLYNDHGINLGAQMDPISGEVTYKEPLTRLHGVRAAESRLADLAEGFHASSPVSFPPASSAGPVLPPRRGAAKPTPDSDVAVDVTFGGEAQGLDVQNKAGSSATPPSNTGPILRNRPDMPFMLYDGGQTPLNPRRR